VPPVTVTVPPLMRIVPAASRLTVIVLLIVEVIVEHRKQAGGRGKTSLDSHGGRPFRIDVSANARRGSDDLVGVRADLL
jgi:hypothetical protein